MKVMKKNFQTYLIPSQPIAKNVLKTNRNTVAAIAAAELFKPVEGSRAHAAMAKTAILRAIPTAPININFLRPHLSVVGEGRIER